MEVDKLYRIKTQDYRGNTDPSAILLLKGNTVSIGFLGRQALPATKADMINLLNADTIKAEGAYSFELLPRYICFTGTADSIELVNYEIELIGDIS
jgi:hypothetical protein